jgi:transcriptional regulator with PAS, ATPase and Fis domain
MVYQSQQMHNIVERCRRIAHKDKDVSIIILGDTGVGKNVLAHYIHEQTPERCNHRFIEACLARDDNLLDSMLFGNKKGAYTGAYENHDGAFALAKGGTIFLDEIANLSVQGQFKLLKVVDERKYLPVGGKDYVETDVRIIAATNKPIEYLTEGTHFRVDLYSRLCAEVITIPPLRERVEDIVPIAEHFVDEWNKQHHTSYVLGEGDKSVLLQYSFPYNVRELKHVVEATARWSDKVFDTGYMEGLLIPKEHIAIAMPNSVNSVGLQAEFIPLKKMCQKAESEYIKKALIATDYNILRAAKLLGMNRGTLAKKVKAYHLHKHGA